MNSLVDEMNKSRIHSSKNKINTHTMHKLLVILTA